MKRFITVTTLLALASLLSRWPGPTSSVPMRGQESIPRVPQKVAGLEFVNLSVNVGSPNRSAASDGTMRQDRDGVNRGGVDRDDFPEVVESNIKVQMRLVFRPAFEQLKQQIGSAAVADEEIAWTGLQGNALILAELLGRLEQWPELSVFKTPEEIENFQQHLQKVKVADVKKSATQLYRATRAEDFEQSQELFAKLVQDCNVCHAATPSWSPVVLRP